MVKILLLLFLSSSQIYALSIISDLDDTIKITGRGARAAVNAFGTKRVYLGMDKFLMEMKANKLFILTSSPNALRRNIFNLLDKFNINVDQLITLSWVRELGGFNYKYREVIKILEESDDEFILIGDDLSHDEAVYLEAYKRYPEKVKAIYIRHAFDKIAHNPEVKYFHTSFDLALYEKESKRLSHHSVINIFKSYLGINHKFNSVIPRFAYCPKVKTEFFTPLLAPYHALVDKLHQDINQACLQR